MTSPAVSMRARRGIAAVRWFPAVLSLATVALAACGPADVTATASGAPASLTLARPASSTLKSLGDSILVTARVLDAAGHVVSDARVQWQVQPAGVLTLDGDGRVRAIANGRATLVARVERGLSGVRPSGYHIDAVQDSVVITVAQQAADVQLTRPDTAFISLRAVRTMSATLADARGNPLGAGAAAPPHVAFTSSNSGIVTVDSLGHVQSVGEGVAQVTARAGTLSRVVTFSVQPRRPHTSCMVYSQRNKSRQTCITVQMVMTEKGATP